MTKEIKVKEKTTVNPVPKGAKILSKEVTTTVEEITNGWLIIKNYDVRYQEKGKTGTDYAYWSDKTFSDKNPVQIKETFKPLADKF